MKVAVIWYAGIIELQEILFLSTSYIMIYQLMNKPV